MAPQSPQIPVTVLVTCARCGSVSVPLASVTVRFCIETADRDYRFRCPTCQVTTLRTATGPVTTKLVSAGVTIERWHLPLELLERPASTELSPEDVEWFSHRLDDLSWLDSPSEDGYRSTP